MGVVLRCPSCGTTRATPGECEVCGPVQVRYFCTNHTPGRWLIDRVCETCGARFGELSRKPAATPAPAPDRRGGYAASREPVARAEVIERVEVVEDVEEASGPALAPWQTLLGAALRARAAAIATRTAAAPAVGLGGCLRRVLLTVVVLMVAFAIAVFFFGRALLQSFQPY